MSTQHTHTCPMCSQPVNLTPAKLVQNAKNIINFRLNELTNPPMNVIDFWGKALPILREYDLADIISTAPYYDDDNPYTIRALIAAPWDCYLVLQFCYGKMEVAYLS